MKRPTDCRPVRRFVEYARAAGRTQISDHGIRQKKKSDYVGSEDNLKSPTLSVPKTKSPSPTDPLAFHYVLFNTYLIKK